MADGASSEAKRVLELARGEDNPTRDEVTDAIEILKLKEHQRPEGFVSWNGTAFVRIPEKLVELLARNPSVDQVRAACVLLLDECAEADAQLEEQVRSDAYETALQRTMRLAMSEPSGPFAPKFVPSHGALKGFTALRADGRPFADENGRTTLTMSELRKVTP